MGAAPSFDIFESDLDGGNLKRLTTHARLRRRGALLGRRLRICFTSERDGVAGI